ncbi:Na+/H+ antiporter subunit E [Immundisolibacter sp.]|uniref:Na+/H+ antiporter subunit E n=1 Tax=Immundisolibacter sp. TaxID=1934948 RepID=UPI000EC687ED|nr:Na+/H+ antiporter subunit E [Gammaproteobacteria bacterium]
MRRWLPQPLLSTTLLVVWLLLNNTLAPAHLLLGALLAWLLPLLAAPFRPAPVRLRRPLLAARLLARVLGDIVLANLEVARRILGPEDALTPRFVWVPLDIEHPWGIATLAGIITLTPGTVSSDLSADRRYLLVHALNVDDPDALVAGIKARYERPLMEVFA